MRYYFLYMFWWSPNTVSLLFSKHCIGNVLCMQNCSSLCLHSFPLPCSIALHIVKKYRLDLLSLNTMPEKQQKMSHLKFLGQECIIFDCRLWCHSGQIWGQIVYFCTKRILSDTRTQLKLNANFEGETSKFFQKVIIYRSYSKGLKILKMILKFSKIDF